VALYDLHGPEVALVLEDLPSLGELRDEFGTDVALVSTFEAAIEHEAAGPMRD